LKAVIIVEVIKRRNEVSHAVGIAFEGVNVHMPERYIKEGFG
jgi:hypothetical protein